MWCWSWSSNTLPPDAKSQLIGKDPDAGKDWRQEEMGVTGWGSWMASLTQWTWVWANSWRWWRTGKLGVLLTMGLQNRTQLSNWATTKTLGCRGFPWWLTNPASNTLPVGCDKKNKIKKIKTPDIPSVLQRGQKLGWVGRPLVENHRSNSVLSFFHDTTFLNYFAYLTVNVLVLWHPTPPHPEPSLVAQMVKQLPAMQNTQVQSLGQEDPWKREWQLTPVDSLSWRIPWTDHGVEKMWPWLRD